MSKEEKERQLEEETVTPDAKVVDSSAEGTKCACEESCGDESPDEKAEKADEELQALKKQLEDKSKQCDEYLDLLQRKIAEFENYKKRTAKEKESIYSEAVSDIVKAFLPVIDSIDRAILACAGEGGEEALKEGFKLVKRQMDTALKNIGVEEIQTVGEAFNPELHEAVMHIEDEAYGQNVIVEELQKGFIYKNKVIRHSMVKVAN